jgi:hypothetical protein
MAAIEVANHRCDLGERSLGRIVIRRSTRLTAAGNFITCDADKYAFLKP